MKYRSFFIITSFILLWLKSYTWFVVYAQSSSTVIDVTLRISVCGDTIVEGPEDCEGEDLNGNTCLSLGYGGGDLACDVSCSYDTSSCIPPTPTPTPSPTPTPTTTPTSQQSSSSNQSSSSDTSGSLSGSSTSTVSPTPSPTSISRSTSFFPPPFISITPPSFIENLIEDKDSVDSQTLPLSSTQSGEPSSSERRNIPGVVIIASAFSIPFLALVLRNFILGMKKN